MKIGGAPPKNPDECPLTLTGRKALSIYKAGMENDGKKLYAYFRWLNLSNPQNSRGYSPMEMATISGGTQGEEK